VASAAHSETREAARGGARKSRRLLVLPQQCALVGQCPTFRLFCRAREQHADACWFKSQRTSAARRTYGERRAGSNHAKTRRFVRFARRGQCKSRRTSDDARTRLSAMVQKSRRLRCGRDERAVQRVRIELLSSVVAPTMFRFSRELSLSKRSLGLVYRYTTPASIIFGRRRDIRCSGPGQYVIK
jgi:hypothetical protein